MASSLLPDRLSSLASVSVSAVLSEASRENGNALAVLATGEGHEMVLKVRATPLPSDVGGAEALIRGMRLAPRMPYSGTEYGYYTARVGGDGDAPPPLAVDVVCASCLPDDVATAEARAKLHAKHVARATAQPSFLFRESPEDYKAVHLGYINDIPAGAIGWVHKILKLGKEREKLLYNDDQFLMNVDPKWTAHPPCDGAQLFPDAPNSLMQHECTRTLYCLGLCHRGDIRSLRDLTAEHLPLLRLMREKGTQRVAEVYGVPRESLRIFVHYPPQFYHFHVHFTHVSVDFGIQTERAHLLDDVIDNLSRDGSFYATCSLTVRVSATDKLAALLRGRA